MASMTIDGKRHVGDSRNGKAICFSLASLVVGCLAQAQEPVFEKVKATPRYPWSDKVDFEVQVAGALPKGAGIAVYSVEGDGSTPVQEWYYAQVPSASGDTTLMKFTVNTGRPAMDIGAGGGINGNNHDAVIDDDTYDPYVIVIDESFYDNFMVVGTVTGNISFRKNFSDVANTIPTGDDIVLRRISAGRHNLGKGPKGEVSCTFSRPFYIGCAEINQDQWNQLHGNMPHPSAYDFTMSPPSAQTISDRAKIPVYNVSYTDIRGAGTLADWPNTSAVDPGSFMGILRQKTNRTGFDLPTEAQWQVACMAGSTAPYNGGPNAVYGLPATGSGHYVQLDLLGRYLGNQQYPNSMYQNQPYPDNCVSANCANQGLISTFTFRFGPNEVCSYLRNAFDLYDMHGNVREWCLDWYAAGAFTSTMVDPVGPLGPDPQANGRVVRGGGWNSPADQCAATYREFLPDALPFSDVGFRVAYNVPAPTQVVSHRGRVDSPIGPGREFNSAGGSVVNLPYNTAWNNAESVAIRVNGKEVFKCAAPAEGSFAWNTAGLAPGDYTLELDDGVETATAICHLTEPSAPAAPTFKNVKATPRYPWNGKIDFEVDVNVALPEGAGIAVRSVKKEDGTPLHEWYHAPIPTPVGGVAHLTFTVDTWSVGKSVDDKQRVATSSSGPMTTDITEHDATISDEIEITIEDFPYDYMIVSTVTGEITYTNGWDNVDGHAPFGDLLILRRIPAGTFRLEESACLYYNGQTNLCTITRPFYMGLSEVDQDQWSVLMKNISHPSATDYTFSPPGAQTASARAKIPVYNVSYLDIRGIPSLADWPNTSAVDPNSFMGVLRDRTSKTGFDLPTEVQWQIACMGGWQAPFNSFASPHTYWISSTNSIHHTDLDHLGRYLCNQEYPNPAYPNSPFPENCFTNNCTNQNFITNFTFSAGPNEVCRYLRNGYDLYDMHGNVREWCLDWYDRDNWPSSRVDAVGPNGPVFGRTRVVRGGGWNSGFDACRAAARDYLSEDCKTNDVGFRVAYNLPPPSRQVVRHRFDNNLLRSSVPGLLTTDDGSVALPYNTAWNNAEAIVIRANGEIVFTADAPAAGTFNWSAAHLDPGIYTLELDDGVEVSTVKCLVKISPEDEVARTQMSEIHVPYSWLASYPFYLMAAGNDFEKATKLLAANEKFTLGECYLAGLSPNDQDADFKADIKILPDGTVKVTGVPDLGDQRRYTVEGKETLDGDWEPADYNRHRFFRVKVSLP